ncbi:methyltransferase domain-containing protein [Colletotrichum sojae]|uniref:Methyltransferase domain-containing protein n=1 Tax=Colletotrichum sojae TaxID=2175907 RepID=A0A8H6JU61_9PEZI|nr:methyltransferase domain-containing protein [Colletotrichum sojae]
MDAGNDDADSTLGHDDYSATTSLRSSIVDYRVENGRTYHRYKEGNRLDLQHHLFLLAFENKLGFAPPNEPDWEGRRVLDVGAGTGIWCIDFGDEHPDVDVLGFDLSATQPEFVNINKPGGYIELQEADSRILSADGSAERGAFHKSLSYVSSALEVFGSPFIPLDDLASLLPRAGFVDVSDRRFVWPLNSWPRDPHLSELGSWTRENLACNTAGMIMAPMTRVHGWRQEEVHVFAAEVRRALADRGNHGYWPM